FTLVSIAGVVVELDIVELVEAAGGLAKPPRLLKKLYVKKTRSTGRGLELSAILMEPTLPPAGTRIVRVCVTGVLVVVIVVAFVPSAESLLNVVVVVVCTPVNVKVRRTNVPAKSPIICGL